MYKTITSIFACITFVAEIYKLTSQSLFFCYLLFLNVFFFWRKEEIATHCSKEFTYFFLHLFEENKQNNFASLFILDFLKLWLRTARCNSPSLWSIFTPALIKYQTGVIQLNLSFVKFVDFAGKIKKGSYSAPSIAPYVCICVYH